MTSFYKYVILGGGVAAGYAAQEFARQGIHPGELGIVSAEERLPYERPPLSKDFLAGEKTVDDILINEPSFYEKHRMTVHLGTAVKEVNLEEKRLYADGEVIAFEKLLIATGSQVRTLDVPGAGLDNIFYLRRVEDARRIREKAQSAQKAVVVGGGFIGMEAAAVLQSGGVQTTLLFPGERVWQRLFTPQMSAFFTDYYRQRGVTILPQQQVAAFGGDGRVQTVVTKEGRQLEADLVVAGIGVEPNSAIFEGQGLQLEEKKICVNRFLETNIPDVLAAGDVTYYRDVTYDRPLHIEHWDNAKQQGQHAARVMMGLRQPYEHVPYFFSDEFDLSYEFWGDTQGAQTVVHRGDVADGRFSTWWLGEDGRLLAAFVMNRPDEEREMAQEWIKAGKELEPEWLQNSETWQ